jgi:hypothetical protein
MAMKRTRKTPETIDEYLSTLPDDKRAALAEAREGTPRGTGRGRSPQAHSEAALATRVRAIIGVGCRC